MGYGASTPASPTVAEPCDPKPATPEPAPAVAPSGASTPAPPTVAEPCEPKPATPELAPTVAPSELKPAEPAPPTAETPELTPAWASEAERIFKLADKDSSGTIDMAELTNLRNVPEFAEQMMMSLDLDKSGALDLPEWLTYIEAQVAKSERATMKLLELFEKQIGDSKQFTVSVTQESSPEEPAPPVAMLVISEIAAFNVPDADARRGSGRSDPYVKVCRIDWSNIVASARSMRLLPQY